MEPSSDSQSVKFTNPKWGTKFLLLQRMCNNEEQSNRTICSGLNSSVANLETKPNMFSRFSRNMDCAVTNEVCNPNDSHRPNCKSLPQDINSRSSNVNSNLLSSIKRKRKRAKANRRGQRFNNNFDCFAPNPVPSREFYPPKLLFSTDFPKPMPNNEYYKPESIIKSQNITLVRENIIFPTPIINQHSNDDSDGTGIITQKVLGRQPMPISFTKTHGDNSSDDKINLSISEESHIRVLLTPLDHSSHVNNAKLEPEIIVLSSDSSNKSDMSELDSNNQSPSLLENVSIPIEMVPSEAVILNRPTLYNNCKFIYSQKLATKFEVTKLSKEKNLDSREVDTSKNRKETSPTLQTNKETCIEVDLYQNEQDSQSCCSLSVPRSKHIEDIDKGSRKCLKLILSVLCSHFEISYVDCLKLLENNQYNLLTTLLELQSLSFTQQ